MPKAQKRQTGARVLDQRWELVDVDSIKEHPENPNIGDIDRIRESIRTSGFYNAVKLQRSTGYILAGTHSWKAAKLEGLIEIPGIWLDVDDVEALRILLADNETARRAEYDEAVLDQLLERLESVEGGLVGTGFDLDWLAQREAAEEAEEEAARQEAERQKQSARGNEVDEDAIPDDQYEAQWAVIIVCESEAAQREIFAEQKELGRTVRVVSV